VAYPLYQTDTHPYVPLWSNCDALRSLDTLLRDIVCIQYFRKFLAIESTADFILCWVEIELFKDLGYVDGLKHHAKRIYDKYLAPSQEFSMRLNSWAKNKVSEAIESDRVSLEVFEEIQHEIFEYMNAQFPKFLASDSCRECMQQLESEEHLRDVLEKSDMI